jgi:hypothetical protein
MKTLNQNRTEQNLQICQVGDKIETEMIWYGVHCNPYSNNLER